MKRNSALYGLLFYIGFLGQLLSQTTSSKIKIRKPGTDFYFFQLGKIRDSIASGQGDVFYLRLSDSLKKNLIFSIDNAQLLTQSGDTLFRLRPVAGIRYECYFEKRDSLSRTIYVWKNYVNGASPLQRHIVRVQIMERNKPETILENRYIYR